MKNYAVKSDGNVDRNKRIIKAFEALGVENTYGYAGNAVAKNSYYNSCNTLCCSIFHPNKIITLEELEELAYNLPKEGDEVWAWDDYEIHKIRAKYLGTFKNWHMVKYISGTPLSYKKVQKINPNEEKIKKLEAKIKEIQEKLEELKR
jgi:hypothetical protein